MGAASTSAVCRPVNYGDKRPASSDRKKLEATHGGILDDLHRPSEFSDDVHVRQCCHVTVRPGVNGDIRMELLERSREQRGVGEDIGSDHEVSGRDLIPYQIIIQQVGSLKPVRIRHQNCALAGNDQRKEVSVTWALTAMGPSSKERPSTPSGASQISPGALHP